MADLDNFDDFFKRDDDKRPPNGHVIDVTPKKEREGVDFDDDKSLLEQQLERGHLGIDRTDKRPGCREQTKKIILILSLTGTLICLLIYIL